MKIVFSLPSFRDKKIMARSFFKRGEFYFVFEQFISTNPFMSKRETMVNVKLRIV